MSINGWVPSAEVSAVGAGAARSREVLNWALAIDGSGFSSSAAGSGNILKSISTIWGYIRNFTVVVFVVLLIIIGFGIMLRTDWGTRSRRLLPYILIALIVMNFSFIASATLVRLTDKLQQGFYAIPHGTSQPLSASDLLTVKYKYQDFQGYRMGQTYSEDAVRTQLWLVRLTTYTNYAIAIIIILRIIILWGLTIFSPFLFPFLIFPATRKVAIIWVREFFRWLFIGPLLALFVSSVAYIWSKTSLSLGTDFSGIPIVSNATADSNMYYSGTNIILVPPGKYTDVGMSILDETNKTLVSGSRNNLKDTDTYMRFIVALVMLWAAIILPFLLLRMAIVMVTKNRVKIAQRWEGSAAKQYLSNIQQRIAPPAPRGPKPVPAAGLARPIAVAGIAQPQRLIDTEKGREVPTRAFSASRISQLKTESIMQLAGLTQAVPQTEEILQSNAQKLERVAQIETDNYKVAKSQEIFNKISRPTSIENVDDRRQFTEIGTSISNMSVRGDTDARRLQKAVENNVSNYETANPREEIQRQMVKKYATEVNNYLGVPGESASAKGTTRMEVSNVSVENKTIQNFQKVYNTTTKNIHEYLQEKAGQKDGKAQMALQALEKVAQVAQVALKPVSQITSKDRNNVLSIANKVEHPEAIADEDEKKQFSALKDFVGQGTKMGDIDAATLDYAGKLMLWSKDAEDKNKLTGELDKKLLERTTAGDKDYAKTKSLWKKHYTSAPVPSSDKVKSRQDWLRQEKQKLQAALDKLLSADSKDRKSGLEEVKKVIPFMLMGDYSLTDIAKYIMAKIDAINDTLKDLEMIEGKKSDEKAEEVLVPVKKKEAEPEALHAQAESDGGKTQPITNQ